LIRQPLPSKYSYSIIASFKQIEGDRSISFYLLVPYYKNNRYDKTFVKRPVFKVEITTRLLKDNFKVFYYLWRIKVKTTCNFGQKTIKSGCRFAWWFPEDGAAELYGWSKSNINILTGDKPPHNREMGSVNLRGALCKIYKASV